jgi:uncharacterized protein YcnI
MKRSVATLLALTVCFLVPALAHAHIGASSSLGAGIANVTQEVSFTVGHGCEDADTYRVRMEIPAGVTSVRPAQSDFGRVTVEKNGAGDVIAIVWQKAEADLHASDISYYKLVVRLRLPDRPFTTLYFPTHQTCKKSDGTLITSEWIGTPENSQGPNPPEPAPALNVVPARKPGWNKFKVPAAIPDLKVFFNDAQIVWKGSAAYSSNPATLELAKATSGVTELTALQANDEIWVKY